MFSLFMVIVPLALMVSLASSSVGILWALMFFQWFGTSRPVSLCLDNFFP